MTDAQVYVAWLSRLLAEYGSDPEKCEAIRRRDREGGPGLLWLMVNWYHQDLPEAVTTTIERGTLESADNRDIVFTVRSGKTRDDGTMP